MQHVLWASRSSHGSLRTHSLPAARTPSLSPSLHGCRRKRSSSRKRPCGSTAEPLASSASIDANASFEEIENEIIESDALGVLPEAEVDALTSLDSEAGLSARGYIDAATASVEEENPYDEHQDAELAGEWWGGGEPEVEKLLREAQADKGRNITVDRLQRLFPFPLDKFQRRAVEKLLDGKSVVVCAPTGAGKTAIAEAAAAACLAKGLRVIYTTPLKALSNQKLLEVRQRFGQSRAGLQTGDTSLNTEADIVVMTTEILRNIMYRTTELNGMDSGTRERRLGDVGLVVLDEVHYLGHPDRGSVWEEAIINCPSHIQLLSMSATVSNPGDLGAWISQEQGECETVKTLFRPVPLKWHYCYRDMLQGGRTVLEPLLLEGTSRPQLNARITNRRLNLKDAWMVMTGDVQGAARLDEDEEEALTSREDRQDWVRVEAALKRGGKWGLERQLTNSRVPDLVDIATLMAQEDMLPAIWFILSRRECDTSAQSLDTVPLTTPAEADQIAREVQQLRDEQPDAVRELMVRPLLRGVASHHAGCLPGWKSLIEKLFQKGLIKIVFATGTLAAGINMPARSTVISCLSRKTDDGVQYLPHNELLQMAGRAGRRGYDTMGHCVVLQSRFDGADAAYQIIRKGPEALTSQFTSSYGLVLNLLSSYTLAGARSFLARSFGNYMGQEGHQRTLAQIEKLKQEAQQLMEAFEGNASAAAKELTAATKQQRALLEAAQDAVEAQRCERAASELAAPGGLPRLAVVNIARPGTKPQLLLGLMLEAIPMPEFASPNAARADLREPFYRCVLRDNRLLRVSVSHVVGLATNEGPCELPEGVEAGDLVATFDKADTNPYAWSNITVGVFSCQVTSGSPITGAVASTLSGQDSVPQPVAVDAELKEEVTRMKGEYRKAVKALEKLRQKAKADDEREGGGGGGGRGAGRQRAGMEAMANAKRKLKRAVELQEWLLEERENAWRRFEDVMVVLEEMRALEPPNRVLPLGVIARSLQAQNELWMAVALSHPAMASLTGSELAGVLGALLAPETSRKSLKLGDGFVVAPKVYEVLEAMEPQRAMLFELQMECGLAKWNELLLADVRCGGVTQAWADGVTWREIMQDADMDDGDVARLLMRTIDMLRQIVYAEDLLPWLTRPARDALAAMDRNPVAEQLVV